MLKNLVVLFALVSASISFAESIHQSCAETYTSVSFKRACEDVGGNPSDIRWCGKLYITAPFSFECQQASAAGISKDDILFCKSASWTLAQFSTCLFN